MAMVLFYPIRNAESEIYNMEIISIDSQRIDTLNQSLISKNYYRDMSVGVHIILASRKACGASEVLGGNSDASSTIRRK